MNKDSEAYKTIGEVAEILQLNSEDKKKLLPILLDSGKKNLNRLNLKF